MALTDEQREALDLAFTKELGVRDGSVYTQREFVVPHGLRSLLEELYARVNRLEAELKQRP
jgi:hypothetical protein